MNLFESAEIENRKRNSPLADRMRPRNLNEVIGQKEIIGEGQPLRKAIELDKLTSLILYGPPGTGKTTLAKVIANTTKADFITINAVLAGVKDIRAGIEQAKANLSLYSRKTILFIDEVHRFNKSQQDALLPEVESGVITLIGATTENPFFEVNKALVSRSRIFELKTLTVNELKDVIKSVLSDEKRGYAKRDIRISAEAVTHLCIVANGDARSLLNGLELAVETTKPDKNGTIYITLNIIEQTIQKRAVLYDKDGDAHYDIASAFIKSIRGSDPDASLYWLAKMLYAGEDPKFIFRRMLISASEDIGMADPNAINVVVSALKSFEYIGMPEGKYPLSQACIYLATAPKSDSSKALFSAISAVESAKDDDVPIYLKDGSRGNLGHGDGYLYPHSFEGHWVAQDYLPKSLKGSKFYTPSDQGFEREIKSYFESRMS